MVLRKEGYKNKEKFIKTRNNQRKRYYKQTQGNKRKVWTDKEVDLILEKGMSDSELSSLLKRSIASIQIKRCRCKEGKGEN